MRVQETTSQVCQQETRYTYPNNGRTEGSRSGYVYTRRRFVDSGLIPESRPTGTKVVLCSLSMEISLCHDFF